MEEIEALEDQILGHSRLTRSINFLISVIKFIFGNPDHDDLIEIHQSLNDFSENSNKQNKINTHFEKMFNKLDSRTIRESHILKTIYRELEITLQTINLAKHNNLNLREVKEIMLKVHIKIPIINVLEYSKIYLAKINETLITIYKYPIFEKQCKHFILNSLGIRHSKLQLDETISECENKNIRNQDCQRYVDLIICKEIQEDNCTIPILNNKIAKCNIKQDENEPIKRIDEGNIILSGKFIINNKTISGINLIHFNETIQINNETYKNYKNKLKKFLISNEIEEIKIQKNLESSSDFKFEN